MRKIDKELKVGDVVRLRSDILDGDWREDSPVGWCEEMEDLIGEKLKVVYVRYKEDDYISFQLEHRNSTIENFAYSSNWFEYAEVLEGAVEL